MIHIFHFLFLSAALKTPSASTSCSSQTSTKEHKSTSKEGMKNPANEQLVTLQPWRIFVGTYKSHSKEKTVITAKSIQIAVSSISKRKFFL